MNVCWITPLLGTAPAAAVQGVSDIWSIDVRDLVDKTGNRAETIRERIQLGCELLRDGKRVVVCCDYGVSRSNAIAAGILAAFETIPLAAAVRRVQQATGGTEMKLAPLQAVRAALGEAAKARPMGEHRTVLVTGGSGFVGIATARRLAENGHLVVSPSRQDLDVEAGSIQLDLLVAENDVDCVIHLANPRVYTSNIALGKTLTMLRNVIEVCVTRGVTLVYLSSWEIYSGYRGTLLADESLPSHPRGPYGETKHLCEVMIEHWRRTLGLECSLLRPSPVYGIGSDRPKFIYDFIDKARRSQTIVTHRYINGAPSLDLLHLDDLVSAIVQTVRTGFKGTINLGTGVTTSTRTVAEMLKQMVGSSSQIEETFIDTEAACIAMDTRKAQSCLLWRPTISLEQGLERILSEVP